MDKNRKHASSEKAVEGCKLQLTKGEKGAKTKSTARTAKKFECAGLILTILAAFVQQTHRDYLIPSAGLLALGIGATVRAFWFDLRNYASTKKSATLFSLGYMLVFQGLLTVVCVREFFREDEAFGWLRPGNDPTPDFGESVKSFPSNSVFFFLGNNVSVLPGNQSRLPVVKYMDQELITIVRDGKGRAAISGVFRDREGVVGAVLETNQWSKENKITLQARRRGRSGLVITDRSSVPPVEILNVRYINPHAFRVTGLMTIQDGWSLKIATNEVEVASSKPGHTLKHGVFDGNVQYRIEGILLTNEVSIGPSGQTVTNISIHY